jgi:VanZ family protein
MKSPRRFFFYRPPRIFAFFAALVFVLYFSLLPGECIDATFSPEIQSHDNFFHEFSYFVLSTLALCAFFRRSKASIRVRIAIFIVFSLLGGSLELAQSLPAIRRSASWSDAKSNAIGAALGAMLMPRVLLVP